MKKYLFQKTEFIKKTLLSQRPNSAVYNIYHCILTNTQTIMGNYKVEMAKQKKGKHSTQHVIVCQQYMGKVLS